LQLTFSVVRCDHSRKGVKNILSMSFFIHPTAIIDEGCKIGEGTKIWHFSHIMPGAVIGERCNIGQNVFVGANVILGKCNKIQNNVSLYEGVACEDDVFIGPSAVFTNVINPRSSVVRRTEYKKTVIKKGASIGANATILCGITIGEFAFIGAGAVVTKSVSPYALVIGNPARQSGWISEYGYKLVFDNNGKAVCKESKQEYKLDGNKVTRIN